MDYRAILEGNGLTPKEAAVYVAALELGMAPISVIARKAKLRRSTTYEVLRKLSEKGIAEFFVRKQTRYYSVVSPRMLLERVRSSVDALEEALPALSAIQNEIIHKPRITFYEGKNDVQRLFLDCLSTTKEISNYFHPDSVVRYFGYDWLKTHMIKKLVEQKKRVRVIMPDTPLARKFLKERETEERRQRIIPKGNDLFLNEVVIYDDKVAHFSFDEDFAFVIQSKHVSDTHRAIFNLAWESPGLIRG